jgi:hypothetical protein
MDATSALPSTAARSSRKSSPKRAAGRRAPRIPSETPAAGWYRTQPGPRFIPVHPRMSSRIVARAVAAEVTRRTAVAPKRRFGASRRRKCFSRQNRLLTSAATILEHILGSPIGNSKVVDNNAIARYSPGDFPARTAELNLGRFLKLPASRDYRRCIFTFS